MPTHTFCEGSTRHFSTDSTPEPLRAQQFQREMQSIFSVGLAVRSPAAKPLAAQVTGYFGRNLRFAAVKFSPHSTASLRTSRSFESRLLVSCQKQGVAVVSQGDRESRIEPGDFFVIDPSRPFHIETGEIYVHSVYLKPGALRQVLPQLDMLTARAIRPGKGAAALFTSVLDQLFLMMPSMSEVVADDLSDALPYLLAPALRSLDNATDEHASRLKALHRQRIKRFVRDNLWDSNLDANAIARGCKLSSRHLYELFSEEGNTLMRSVWKQRLALCRRDLAEPALRTRTVGEIAYTWGFSNVSHFSRAFKAEFGVGPREFRKALGEASLLAKVS
ncbi:MAG: helix-turn-helix domain-containing protein [Pseudomonadota bacterium]